ncbi:hypothetical protein Pmani_005980 [Petrolisthes manimaculis]|uniref:Uncharacterized protein n=1 Tax=Petrolisthes manimaculis TaxID=1843537 RepID=A0AAE1QAP2_9EUCA|nr:hypothetical protein Pmani_005980 [Petrolisthes manimaculis]
MEKEAGQKLRWNCSFCYKGTAKLHSRIEKIEDKLFELQTKQSVMQEENINLTEHVKSEIQSRKNVEERLIYSCLEAKLVEIESQQQLQQDRQQQHP